MPGFFRDLRALNFYDIFENMPYNPKSKENLKMYTSTFRPKNPGRKKSRLGKVKDNYLSAADVGKVMRMILDSNEAELTRIFSDKTQPMLLRLCVRAYLADLKVGSLANLQTILAYAVGKPVQQILEISGGVDVTDMTPEQRDQIINSFMSQLQATAPDAATAPAPDVDKPAQ